LTLLPPLSSFMVPQLSQCSLSYFRAFQWSSTFSRPFSVIPASCVPRFLPPQDSETTSKGHFFFSRRFASIPNSLGLVSTIRRSRAFFSVTPPRNVVLRPFSLNCCTGFPIFSVLFSGGEPGPLPQDGLRLSLA